METINKILLFLLFLSIVTVLRHLYYLISSFIRTTEENPVRYTLTRMQLFLLGTSIAFILTCIFSGISL